MATLDSIYGVPEPPAAPESSDGAGLAVDVATPTEATEAGAPAPANRYPVRPRVAVDATEVVEAVKRRAAALYDQRDEGGDNSLNAQRLQLYAKYRGWMEEKTWPWPGASNVHIPLLMMSELRTQAGLHNAVLTMRPLVSARAPQSKAPGDEFAQKAENVTDLVDTQLFVDPGPELAERRASDIITGFTQDTNSVVYTPYVKIDEEITTVEYVKPEEGQDPETAFLQWVDVRFGKYGKPVELDVENAPAAANAYAYEVTRADGSKRDVTCRVYQTEDGLLEIECTRDEITADGPQALPVPIEALLVPTRCTNLQPRTAWNPSGAPEVGLEWEYTLGEVERLKAAKVLNYCTDADVETLRVGAKQRAGSAPAEESREKPLEQQKDTMEGQRHETPRAEVTAEEAALPVRIWRWFTLWNNEEMVFEVSRDAGAETLLRANRLRELYPAIRAYRPFAEGCAIPVKDRWHGIPLIKLGESLQDLAKGAFDQAFDANTISTLPFFFYGASSKLSTDVIRLNPGEGYPVPGDPRSTILFPSMPGKDQSFMLQVIALAQQWYEKLTSIGGPQQGQVPTGKASAFRTYGTTAALLQQGDVRADQLLLRLFQIFRQVMKNFHRLNRHFLPREKEIRRLGWDGQASLAYATIKPTDIDLDEECDFDFRPDFQLSNQQMLGQALEKMLMILATPLAIQTGVFTPQKYHALISDIGRALRVNVTRYLGEPAGAADPPITAQDAVSLILAGQQPVGGPLEGAEAHLKALQQFYQSGTFQQLTPEQVQMFRVHVIRILGAQQQERMAQAAAQFQQSAGQAGLGGGEGGTPTTMQEPEMSMSATGSPGGAESAGAVA